MKKLMSILSISILCAVFTTSAFAFEDILPSDAYTMATTDANAYILDVRTIAEWQFVGHPGANKADEGTDLDGKVVNISYKIDMKGALVVNPSFMSEINELFAGNPNVTLIAMCRSGKRSVAAAGLLEAAGYNVKNMVTGFQGGKDVYGYRTVSGWVNAGLPYSYSGAGYVD